MAFARYLPNHKPMKKLLLTFAAFLLLASPALLAQSEVIRVNTEPLAILMRYNGGGNSQGVINNIIYRLAQGNNTPTNTTEYVLVADEFHRLSQVNETTLNVFFALKELRVQGASSYRGFEIAEYILPSGITTKIEQKKNGKTIESFGITDAPLTGAPAVFANYQVTDTTGQIKKNTFSIAFREFVFDQSMLQRFVERCDLIDSYYASGDELETVYNELRRLNPTNLDDIEGEQRRLVALQERIGAVAAMDYAKQLNINSTFDPIKLNAKIKEVEAYGITLENQIAATLSNLPQQYTQRALGHLASGHNDHARQDLNRAIQLDPNFAPAHIHLAKMDYETGNFAEARGRLEDALINMNPDPQSRQVGLNLAENMANSYVMAAMAANKEMNFDAAVANLDEASSLAQRIPELNVSGTVTQQYAIAYRGMYNQHVDIGGQHLAAQKLKMAEIEAIKAQQVQSEHPDFIPDASAANDLLTRVKQAMYANYVAHGKEAVELRRWEEGVEALETAQLMEGTFGISQDTTLFGIIQQGAKEIILQDARKGTAMANANKLGEARQKMMQINADREKYQLMEDADILAAIQSMQDQIFSQECENAKNTYLAKIDEGKAKERKQDYIGAMQMYEEAIAHLQSNSACGLSSETAREAKWRIADAVGYQVDLQEVANMIRTGEYRQAKNLYNKAGSFFQEKSLQKFQLAHDDLLNYTVETRNGNFQYFMAIDYTDAAEYDAAIDLIEILVRKKYAKKMVKELMMRVGAELAERDHAENPTGDPKIEGMRYTRGNSKLKKIAKAYKKRWKAL